LRLPPATVLTPAFLIFHFYHLRTQWPWHWHCRACLLFVFLPVELTLAFDFYFFLLLENPVTPTLALSCLPDFRTCPTSHPAFDFYFFYYLRTQWPWHWYHCRACLCFLQVSPAELLSLLIIIFIHTWEPSDPDIGIVVPACFCRPFSWYPQLRFERIS